jgi:hypothetical protein
MQRAFSTLEAVIAMAILLSALSAVMLTVFGNQSVLTDTAQTSTAREKAENLLAEEERRADSDFNLVNPLTETDATYESTASILLLPDYLTKRVSASTAWRDELGRVHSVTLSELMTNFTHALGGDTCSSALSGDWSAPSARSYALTPGDLLPAVAGAGARIVDVDAYHGALFTVADTSTSATDPSLFIFDISSTPAKPVFISSVDNATSTADGLSAIRIAGTHAYLANNHNRSSVNCKPSASCAELQIADVSTLSAPKIITNYLIPTTTPAFVVGSGTQAVGKTLTYQDGLLYLGLSKTASGPEFNILDVRNAVAPVWIGGYSVGRSINAITIRGGTAYLATDDNATGGKALIALDIHDPTHPTQIASWSASGAGFAKSLTAVGDTLYLGRSYANGTQKELYILDASSTSSSFATLGSADIGTNVHKASVNAVRIRDTLAYLLTSDDIELWNIGDPSHLGPSTGAIPLPNSSAGSALDCEGNYVYAGSNTANTGWLTVLAPS